MFALRDYQEVISDKAVLLLKEYKMAYLSMQVRCGKTLTSLAAADKFLNGGRVLFLTTKKAMSSIQKDYDALKPSFEIIICNYESVHNLANLYFDLIICDESHKLGMFPQPGVRTKQLKELCKGKPIIYLSGTPTPESYSQIYHQFWISDYSPFSEWPNFYKWANEFVTRKKKYVFNREINDYSKAKEDLIFPLIKHLFLSFSQEDAGFVQDVKELVIKVKMKDVTYNLADKMRKKRVHIGQNGEEILADTNVKLMGKLHQIYSGSVMPEKVNTAIHFDDSKCQYIKEHFAGKKIAIFYKFKAEELMLINSFGSSITTSPDEFNNSTDKVFISQIMSGREGINLSTADCLILINIDFSSLSYQQVRARSQSKERTKECLLYWIFSEGGIEEKIYKTVVDKKDYTLRYFKRDFKLKDLANA